MPADKRISLFIFFLPAFLFLSTESRYFKSIENQDKTASYLLRRGARNSLQFQRDLTKIDDRTVNNLKGEDENGDEDQMKRHFENDLPPWYDLKESNPDFRFDWEKPKKHRELDRNELRRLEAEFLARTRELEKKTRGLPKRYDEEKFVRELEEMDEAKSEEMREEMGAKKSSLLEHKREELGNEIDQSELKKREESVELKRHSIQEKDGETDGKRDAFASENRGGMNILRETSESELPAENKRDKYNSFYTEDIKEEEKREEDDSYGRDSEVYESELLQKMVDDEEGNGKDEELEEPEDQSKLADVFSLQCEQLVEGVKLGEGEKECCSKQSSCPVISFMGLLGHTCFCDKEFYNCLRNAGTSTAQDLGTYYFNEMKNKCFTYEEKKECHGEDCVTVQIVDAVDPPQF